MAASALSAGSGTAHPEPRRQDRKRRHSSCAALPGRPSLPQSHHPHYRRGSIVGAVSAAAASTGSASGGSGEPGLLQPRVFRALDHGTDKATGEAVPFTLEQRRQMEKLGDRLRGTFKLLTRTDPIRVARSLDIEVQLADPEDPSAGLVFPLAVACRGRASGKTQGGKTAPAVGEYGLDISDVL